MSMDTESHTNIGCSNPRLLSDFEKSFGELKKTAFFKAFCSNTGIFLKPTASPLINEGDESMEYDRLYRQKVAVR